MSTFTTYRRHRSCIQQQQLCVCVTPLYTNAAPQAQLKKAAKKAAKGVAAAAPGKLLSLEKGKDVITEQM